MNVKNLLLIGLISLTNYICAQNEISKENQYIIGDTIYFEGFTDVEVSSGASGIDLTWDFSNLDLTQPDSTYLVYAHPDELTGLAALAAEEISPNINLIAKSYNNDGINDFILFRYQDENIVEAYGSFYIPLPQITKLSNPQILFNFPMPLYSEISNTYTDSIFHEDPVQGGWNLVNTIERQNYSVFDGVGTVITEKGTFANCLRLKRIRPGGSTIYTWIQNTIGNIVVTITEYDDVSKMSSIKFGSGNSILTTSINEEQKISKPSIYLTFDRLVSLTIEQGIYDYFILDGSGRQISKGTINHLQTNLNHDLFKNVNTPFGIYYIVFVNNRTGDFNTTRILIP